MSEAHNQEQGVPQGSILSVTLFSHKINNIVKCLNPGVDCSLYLDDFLICYRSKNMNTIERQLQLNLNKIQKWATENGFKFSKSKSVGFGSLVVLDVVFGYLSLCLLYINTKIGTNRCLMLV